MQIGWLLLMAVTALFAIRVAIAAADDHPEDSPPAPACPETEPTVAAATPAAIPARIEGPSGVVALTFDAGADRGYAEDILDTLAESGIPATFGITGRWALANPDLVERVAAE